MEWTRVVLMPTPLPPSAAAAPPKHRPVAAGSLREGHDGCGAAPQACPRSCPFRSSEIVSMLTICCSTLRERRSPLLLRRVGGRAQARRPL